eukprot:7339736-Pyramimonas_sp.AAC.1
MHVARRKTAVTNRGTAAVEPSELEPYTHHLSMLLTEFLCTILYNAGCCAAPLNDARGRRANGNKPEQVTGGLSGLVEAVLGLPLDKRHQCSDWDARPLSPEQLAYAAQRPIASCSVLERPRADMVSKILWRFLPLVRTPQEMLCHLRKWEFGLGGGLELWTPQGPIPGSGEGVIWCDLPSQPPLRRQSTELPTRTDPLSASNLPQSASLFSTPAGCTLFAASARCAARYKNCRNKLLRPPAAQ